MCVVYGRNPRGAGGERAPREPSAKPPVVPGAITHASSRQLRRLCGTEPNGQLWVKILPPYPTLVPGPHPQLSGGHPNVITKPPECIYVGVRSGNQAPVFRYGAACKLRCFLPLRPLVARCHRGFPYAEVSAAVAFSGYPMVPAMAHLPLGHLLSFTVQVHSGCTAIRKVHFSLGGRIGRRGRRANIWPSPRVSPGYGLG